MTTELTDDDLLRAHREGDEGAFAQLLQRHADRLWSVALLVTGEPDAAARALEAAVLAASHATGEPELPVGIALQGFVAVAALDEAARGESGSAGVASGDDEGDPVLAGLRREVVTAFGALSGQERAALALVDLEGCTVEEAALLLDAEPATVASWCARGRARLVPLLAHVSVP